MLFSFSTALWFIFYVLSYSFTQNLEYLEIFIKSSYFLSTISLYSFLLFLIYFDRKKGRVIRPISIWVFIIALLLCYIYIGTSWIIDGLYFNTSQQDWYESEGILFNIHLILTFLFIPLAIYLSRYRLLRIWAIDKKRLQYILWWVILFIFLTIVSVLVLPLFWVFSFEQYIGLFFLPFIFSVLYSTRKYDFLNFKLAFIRVSVFVCSILFSFLIVLWFKEFWWLVFPYDFKNYWGISWDIYFLEFLWAIILFLLIQYFLKQNILPYFKEEKLYNMLEEIKTALPFITSLVEVNSYLRKTFNAQCNISYVMVINDISDYCPVIINYFDWDNSRKYYMNDIVFLEENKNKILNYKTIKHQDPKTYIVFPLRDSHWKTVWVFEVWAKALADPYYTNEIQILSNFTYFISWYLKYLSVYRRMQDLSINLDRKVDEKTIEYNNLLSKQKEFIAYVWHEIKNPITNTLFLSESITSDIKSKVTHETQKDAEILYDELVKISHLVKYIFSAEKFDLNKVELYKNKINFSKFLSKEIESLQYTNERISFDVSIQEWIYFEIDEIQFRQVIQNLINNSIKFNSSENPQIHIKLQRNTKHFTLNIEDNGWWLTWEESKNIFDKYSTWTWNASGLGMGLYLCKRIINLHWGKIVAEESHRLWWARFTITI